MFPLVSVVIPMRNEAQHITTCVSSLLASDFPPGRLEILVVDGISTDNSREFVQNLQKEHSEVRLLENHRKTTPCAMNIGIKEARGSYVLIMSAHAECPPNFLRSAVKCIQEVDADVVGGPIVTAPSRQTFIATAIASVVSHKFGVGNCGFRTDPTFHGYVDSVPFGLYKRETFQRFGVFDENLTRNQDNEIHARIRSGGGKIYMSPSLVATYFAEGKLWRFCSKAFKTGFWNTITFLAGFRGMSARHFIPGLFVTSLVVAALASLVFRSLAFMLWVLLATYFLCAVTASIQIGLTKRSPTSLVLPLLFFVFHVSYGIGNLWAVVSLNWQSSKSRNGSG